MILRRVADDSLHRNTQQMTESLFETRQCRLAYSSHLPPDGLNPEAPTRLRISPRLLFMRFGVVPAEGFEPPTTRLRSGCSTAELRRLNPRH
jgi:hypothetical protein